MKWICENCDFDAVVIQEYSYYSFDDSTEVTNFNNIVNYLRNNYNKAFKVFTFIDAPMRNRVASDYEKAKKYAQLLYSQALLIAGLPLEDPSGYTDLVCELMK